MLEFTCAKTVNPPFWLSKLLELSARLKNHSLVAEFGSLAVGGNRAEWYQNALSTLPTKYPAVKALLFFETGTDQTVTYQKVDWRIATDSIVAAAVARSIAQWAPPITTTR